MVSRPDMSGLCKTIADADDAWASDPSTDPNRHRVIADAVLAAGWYQPRVCTAVHQLVNTPAGSVLRTATGRITSWDQGAHLPICGMCSSRHSPDCDWFFDPSDLPVTVIWETR